MECHDRVSVGGEHRRRSVAELGRQTGRHLAVDAFQDLAQRLHGKSVHRRGQFACATRRVRSAGDGPFGRVAHDQCAERGGSWDMAVAGTAEPAVAVLLLGNRHQLGQGSDQVGLAGRVDGDSVLELRDVLPQAAQVGPVPVTNTPPSTARRARPVARPRRRRRRRRLQDSATAHRS
jgi:hypothetical protein